ncbi:MAG TPA: ATP-binding protein, partial [Burkholderiales bacterium]|nr:ATP-binding protein [Burkholderiales bacterium]
LNRGSLILDNFTGSFRVNLDERAGKPVNVVQVVVGPTGFIGAPEQAVVDYIRSMYADRPAPDLIMTAGGPAAVFARKYRQQLFPRTPLVLAAVDERYLRGAPLAENETAVAAVNDIPRVVDGILQVLPETKQVFMVIGSGTIGRFWRRELETSFARFQGRVTFIWSDALSLSDILGRVSNLPKDSAIVYLLFSADAQGGAYADEQALAAIHTAANAPLFSAHSSHFGYGIVGGSLMPMDDLAQRTADVVTRVMNGEPPANLTVPPQLLGQPTFDWRELQRWHIPETRLPDGSVVKFRPPSLWDEYKLTILAAVAALVVQSLLILWLLFEHRARQRAEIESRRNMALAADANRRETMSALTASIGHELAQPLTSVLLNVQALQRMLKTRRVTAEETDEILADIRTEAALAAQITDRHRTMLRGRQLDKKPIDLHSVINESLALVGNDMRARQIEMALDLCSPSCFIEGDHVLLQQVLLNLLRNAMDALGGTLPARRQITIQTSVKAANVELCVSDTGTGVPADKMDELFTPFVTTKSHGLGIGLTIARSIVDAHRGTIVARANLDGGATFIVTLPRGNVKALAGAVESPKPVVDKA